ncbi:MerR family transcriptional regulator [Amycolatopsis carbonis]|uniref:MerR family transcriptional regulator n=1 Tax=Amycolatopsis carbonis TaxID=715471 RepID=A0A9Y2I835_9PSEU|nr:MerR family transcriptional regulator [Amycolatopsis sp. 2-15]WIX75059.1 MerR family transcriptional regulator [Amycolatopsis sp. 2-15]
MGPRLTIGDFSRLTHLSVKTLRHYHQVGLLEPCSVDPHTGYRFYDLEQIPSAQVIRRLRDLEMPVADVRAVLAAPEVAMRNSLIAAHLDSLEAELARTRQAVDTLRDLLRRPDTAFTVEHRTVAPAPAAAIQQTVDREDVLTWWQGALGELHATVRAQGLTPAGPAGGLYESDVYLHDRGRVTVFVPVEGTPREVGRVVGLVVPAAELAIAYHRGSLDDVDLTYGTLGAYVTGHEIGVDGPLREYYVRGADDTRDTAEWRTEIGWPVFRADAG